MRSRKKSVNIKSKSNNQKRAVLGKRANIDEIIHRYIEEIFGKFDDVMRRFSLLGERNISYGNETL